MDFIVHNYYKISSKPSLQFYWLNRNRKFIMKYEEVVKEGNNGIFQLPTILTGKYSLALDGYIDMVYSIRVGDKIEHNDNGKQIYFEINVDEVNKNNFTTTKPDLLRERSHTTIEEDFARTLENKDDAVV